VHSAEGEGGVGGLGGGTVLAKKGAIHSHAVFSPVIVASPLSSRRYSRLD